MYLSKLRIENFRRFQLADLTFQPGLNLIVGENNCGKTALVDAIRTVLDDRRLDIDDLRVERTTRKPVSSVSITAHFDGLTLLDEAAFNQAFVPTGTMGQYQARLAVSATLRDDDIVKTVAAGRGPNAGAYYDVLNARRIIYLPALRDPNSATGLRPGRQSRQADLLRRVSTVEERDNLAEIAREANRTMKDTDPVNRARDVLKGNLNSLSGPLYGQLPELDFVDPEFNRLAAQLQSIADGMSVSLDGLGYANLFYVAAVLGDLEADKTAGRRYRALLIEEPEAHLHPQHQILLLRFLQSHASGEDPVQIFVTTHSPILASQATIHGLLPVIDRWERVKETRLDDVGATTEIEVSNVTTIVKPVKVEASAENAALLTQYLDATRSELFFATRLILVEGDSERILIPELAKKWCGVYPEVLGVTIVSAAGLNFAVFLPFIGAGVLNIPVAIVTDGDPPARQVAGEELEASAYVQKLRELVKDDARVGVFVSARSFEHELAIPAENAESVMAAMGRVRPRLTPIFRAESGNLRGPEFADAFYSYFFQRSNTSKPEFAMELALLIRRGEAPEFVVPSYLGNAFSHALQDPVR